MLLCGFHWHSRYSIWISTFILMHIVYAQGVPVALNCIASGFQGVPVATNHCI